MHSPDYHITPRLPSASAARTSGLFWCCLVAGIATACLDSRARAQEPPLRLGGVMPSGIRMSATESWSTYDFTLTNLSGVDRQARVLAFFVGRPDVQYGRDVWVPAHSSLETWMLVGPPNRPQSASIGCEIEMLLYDRTDGKERLILPPGEERIRSRAVLYRNREPSTSILLDERPDEQNIPGQFPQPDSRRAEAVVLARTFRLARELSGLVSSVTDQSLPPTPETFDGIDHFVLASNRIAHDPAGMQALRQWLQRGGTVWVMLDMVELETVAPLLGDALDFEVVDRISLTDFKIETRSRGSDLPKPLAERHERPVEFVRVLLPSSAGPQESIQTINGWPVWFARQVGRGQVFFTTLGPRGWYRERSKRSDPASPYWSFPNQPIPLKPLVTFAQMFQPSTESNPIRSEAFRPMLTEEIGYTVVSRSTVILVFGGFLLGALVIGLALRKSPRPELLGWLGPVVALGATVAFLAVGEVSRRAAAPTVAVAQIVEADSGNEQSPVRGLLATYRPDPGPLDAGPQRGGHFELDMTGTEGQTRRLVLNDLDSWRWDNLALPAGVRFAPFQASVATGKPIAAVAHFGPEGLEGRLTAAPFEGLADALLRTSNGRNLAIRLRPDGTFSAGQADTLPTGQFLTSAVLNDQQQRRQELLRDVLKPSAPGAEGGNTLLVWARPIDLHFSLGRGARTGGTALLVIPLQLERSPLAKAGAPERMSIPGPLIPYRRILDQGPVRPPRDLEQPIDMLLRFQLPAAVLPFEVERARLVARIDAPGRRVTISGHANGGLVELHRVESPLDPIRLDINEPSLLRPDPEGGLHLHFAFSDLLNQGAVGLAVGDTKWTIEYLEMEVSGKSVGEK
jgi:hypothetical protein